MAKLAFFQFYWRIIYYNTGKHKGVMHKISMHHAFYEIFLQFMDFRMKAYASYSGVSSSTVIIGSSAGLRSSICIVKATTFEKYLNSPLSSYLSVFKRPSR